MISNAAEVITSFLRDHGLDVPIRHEAQPCPHKPHRLPLGMCAVYVFSLSEAHGRTCPAGPNRVLKIGRVGPNSNARFQSQHYHPGSCQSNLAKSLVTEKGRWNYLGISHMDERAVGSWIKNTLDRDNFFLNGSDAAMPCFFSDMCGRCLGRYLKADRFPYKVHGGAFGRC